MENLIYKVECALLDKSYRDGLDNYTQANCQVTLTDNGFRIYRPPNLTTANNGSIIVSENKEGLLSTVEAILYTSKKIIEPENIEYHTQAVADCESIMKKLNPTFAKEKERDARIESLENKVSGMDDKLDKIFNLINEQ